MMDMFINAVFADNLALSYFLGICTFLAVSRRVDTAIGLGLAIILVQTITVPVNFLVFQYVLNDGALDWLNLGDIDLGFLTLTAFIGVIAAMVQILEMLLDRFSPTLYRALGIFLPLITVNCAILGASLFMVERQYSFNQSLTYGFSTGVGWAFAVVLFAAIRERLVYSRVPQGLQGLGLAFLVTGLISMGFSAFAAGNLP